MIQASSYADVSYSLYKAYDSHCNLVLGEVEETIYVVEDEDANDDDIKVRAWPGFNHVPSISNRIAFLDRE